VNVGAGNINNNGFLVPLSVKIGDTVLLPEYGGSEITLDGNILFIYRDSDVLGVLHKE
jgi:chaperonin GroES